MRLNKYLTIALLGLAVVFSACSKKADKRFDTAASTDAAAKYVGEWTKLEVATETVTTVAGTVTLSEYKDENGNIVSSVANILVTSEGSDDRSDVCNIAHANNGFVFYNNAATTFGAKFSGEIDAAGTLTMQYQVEEQAGRSKKVFKYNFTGKK